MHLNISLCLCVDSDRQLWALSELYMSNLQCDWAVIWSRHAVHMNEDFFLLNWREHDSVIRSFWMLLKYCIVQLCSFVLFHIHCYMSVCYQYIVQTFMLFFTCSCMETLFNAIIVGVKQWCMVSVCAVLHSMLCVKCATGISVVF